MPTIQMSVPTLLSSFDRAGGGRSPYCLVDENVTHMSFDASDSLKTKGAHFGKELVKLVLPASATPGAFARPSAAGENWAGGRTPVHSVAVASVSASQSSPYVSPAMQVDWS